MGTVEPEKGLNVGLLGIGEANGGVTGPLGESHGKFDPELSFAATSTLGWDSEWSLVMVAAILASILSVTTQRNARRPEV